GDRLCRDGGARRRRGAHRGGRACLADGAPCLALPTPAHPLRGAPPALRTAVGGALCFGRHAHVRDGIRRVRQRGRPPPGESHAASAPGSCHPRPRTLPSVTGQGVSDNNIARPLPRTTPDSRRKVSHTAAPKRRTRIGTAAGAPASPPDVLALPRAGSPDPGIENEPPFRGRTAAPTSWNATTPATPPPVTCPRAGENTENGC